MSVVREVFQLIEIRLERLSKDPASGSFRRSSYLLSSMKNFGIQLVYEIVIAAELVYFLFICHARQA